MKKRIAVLAYSHGQFMDYKGNEKDDEEFIYVCDEKTAQGYNFHEFQVIGSFWDRVDAAVLYGLVTDRLIEDVVDE